MPGQNQGQTSERRDAIIRVRDLVVGFGDRTVLKGLNLDILRGEILGFVGPSGQGKSVLTRTLLGLVPKRAGSIEVFGEDVDALTPARRRVIERRWGVHFVLGGTGKLVDGLVRLIRGQGGRVRLGADVADILVTGGAARGVRLAGGETITADMITIHLCPLNVIRANLALPTIRELLNSLEDALRAEQVPVTKPVWAELDRMRLALQKEAP